MRAFPYYGSKTRLAPLYPEPKFKIIEPFAGAAAYAQRHWEKDIQLYDICPDVVACWQFLIAAKASDVLGLPFMHYGLDLATLTTLSEGERALLRFFAYDGFSGTKGRKVGKRCIWNRYREPLAAQVHHFDHWKVEKKSFDEIENQTATWFIDPPYQSGGKYYDFKGIDYIKLATWSQSREGQVIVCENDKSTWLPFRPLAKLSGLKHTTMEVVWTNEQTA